MDMQQQKGFVENAIFVRDQNGDYVERDAALKALIAGNTYKVRNNPALGYIVIINI